ncbi:MAG: HAMP domain-containing sensor histidine kinase [Ktedonobacteraceae bacterium]
MTTKATRLQSTYDYKERSIVQISLQQRAKLRKEYRAQIPAWRRPLVGYFMTIPIVALGTLLMYFEYQLLSRFYFSGIPAILAIMLVALIWGLGPALFAVLLGSLALGYFYIQPYTGTNAFLQDKLLSLIPFIVAGLIVAIITGQREAARIRALASEQEAEERAQELESANQELEQANQLKDHFLSIASHELKTPITSISGFTQITLRRLSRENGNLTDAADVQTTLQKIETQTQRLNALIDDLLDLNNVRSGRIPLQLGNCDIKATCREAIENQHQLTGRDIELEEPATAVIVKADSDRVNQVITNLISNALKYSPEDAPVQVTIRQHATAVCIAVHDQGQGISKEQQKHIFEAFYRTPDARTSKKRGWGLGLAICKDIIERHNGQIWCESKPGKGATFFVELPVK